MTRTYTEVQRLARNKRNRDREFIWREARRNRHKIKSSWIKIGATWDDYDKFFTAQRGLCAICTTKLQPGRYTHLDHNWKTGELRGLLCLTCNTKLGFVERYFAQILSYLRFALTTRPG